jgi:porin
MRSAVIVMAMAFLLGSNPALAQNVNSGVGIGASQILGGPTPAPATPQVEHLLGDPGGVRTALGNLGIDLTVDATAEFAGNVSGGVKRGATSANQIGVELDIDWQKLAGLTGFSTHGVVVNRSGANDSTLFGDNLQPVQEIYGSGGGVAVHLVYIYGEQKVFGDRIDLAGGWMPVANDFAASTLYCNFVNNGLCGNPKDLPGGDVGFSSYPDAVLGGRIRLRPVPQSYIQLGLYQSNRLLYSYPAYRSGFAFNTSGVRGAEIPLEVAWEPRFGAADLPGHYKLGVGIDTTRYNDLYNDLPTAVAQSHANTLQFWALADQMLLRQGQGDDGGIIGLLGYAHSDPSTATYRDEVFAGLLDKAFWAARPEDTVGLLFTWQSVSPELTRVQELDQEFGLSYANAATGVQSHEETLELKYDIHVFRGVNFEPDFQYVFRPNAQGDIHDAAVLGFKAHVTF